MEIPEAARAPLTGIGAKTIAVSDATEMDGLIVDAEVLDYGDGGGRPTGRVVEVLGKPDDFGIDVEIIIRKHHLAESFSGGSWVEDAERVPEEISAAEIHGRRDFRELPIVTIDGETARDFDDAVLVDKLPNGHFALQVHIADVSHYVKPGTAIDVEAQMRGRAFTFADRAVPMLPFELSDEYLFAEKPQVDRLVLSAMIEFDHQGDPLSFQFCRGVIRSAERYDLYERSQAAGRRRGDAGTVFAAGGAVSDDARTGGVAHAQTLSARIDRFRFAGAAD